MFWKTELSGFNDLWKKVDELKVLPNTAILHVPELLSDKTKKKLMKKTPEEAVKIIAAAIEQVDKHHSTEKLEDLIRKEMKQRYKKQLELWHSLL